MEQERNSNKNAELSMEQNGNMIDGIINNTPTVDELEAKVKAGEQISLVDLANAVKADKERGKGAKPEKKPSIRAQLRADKEKAQKKNAKQKRQSFVAKRKNWLVKKPKSKRVKQLKMLNVMLKRIRQAMKAHQKIIPITI